jgi:hypothetical protein
LPRPFCALTLDKTVSIAPDHPAPPRRDGDMFRDDLRARQDKGSPGWLPLPSASLNSSASSSA